MLRGLLDNPTEVSKAIRAGSIFLLPLYVGIMIVVGVHQSEEVRNDAMWTLLGISYSILAARALI